MGAGRMKYMGSKRSMLTNGLGEILKRELSSAERFVDLFSGSGAVACHVASRYRIPVLACDLQSYSAVLTQAVLGREVVLEPSAIWGRWHRRAAARYGSVLVPDSFPISQDSVQRGREWCSKKEEGLITRSYGGHYFSSEQAVWIDALLTTLPRREPAKTVALASLIQASSICAASPGHTAQPFQPTRTAKKFLKDAWNKNIVAYTKSSFFGLCRQHAMKKGRVLVADALKVANRLVKDDVVFIDPPYSDVQYSRFYHVLETIARGECGSVSGTGRYPEPALRPRSKYSLKTEATLALEELFEKVSDKAAKAVVTFPDHQCSNGLSGNEVRRLAKEHFTVLETAVESRFSTLGGHAKANEESQGRGSRLSASELILVLAPKRMRV